MPIDSEKLLLNPINWVSRQDIGTYNILKANFQDCFNFSDVLFRLLANLELDSREKIDSFLNPSLRDLYDPKLLPNISLAVERLKKAIKFKEKILVFGDYDADGIVSTAILYNFLKKIGADVSYHIPSRFEDGYDINIKFIKNANKEKTCDLIICVDCGTNASEVIKYVTGCTENNIDVISCDHHEATPEKLTENMETAGVRSSYYSGSNGPLADRSYIVVNPKLPGSEYPFKFLSGAGVTFKFIIETLKNMDNALKEKMPRDYLNSILDLVAISTVADLMPLIDENRIIVKEGLKKLNNTNNQGLNKLIKRIIGKKNDFNTYDIGFIISPHINASGRISNAESSLRLLLDSQDTDEKLLINELSLIIDELEKSNSERRELQQATVKEILDNNDFSRIIPEDKIFIAKSKGWSEGVLGIAASEIVKKFNIPVILFNQEENELSDSEEGCIKGSGRSIKNFDLYSNLGSLSHYFKKYGGHKHACGITMELKNFKDFKSSMIEIANEKLTEKDLEKIYYFDAEISFREINFKLVTDIDMLEPFGIGNLKPVFITRNCHISGQPRFLKDNKHIILKLSNSGKDFESIIFNCSDLFPDFTKYIMENLDDKKKINQLPLDILYNIDFKKSPHDDHRIIKLCIQSFRINPQ